MNPFEMVIAIVAITTVGGIIRAKYHAQGGTGRVRDRDRRGLRGFGARMNFGHFGGEDEYVDDRETEKLREEVKMLKDRIHTLERIAVDKESTLARQIDDLRDR